MSTNRSQAPDAAPSLRTFHPQTAVLVEHLQGAVGRVGPEETAFGGRAAQFSLGIFSVWRARGLEPDVRLREKPGSD